LRTVKSGLGCYNHCNSCIKVKVDDCSTRSSQITLCITKRYLEGEFSLGQTQNNAFFSFR